MLLIVQRKRELLSQYFLSLTPIDPFESERSLKFTGCSFIENEKKKKKRKKETKNASSLLKFVLLVSVTYVHVQRGRKQFYDLEKIHRIRMVIIGFL